MTCTDVAGRLDDYVDGLLSEAEFQELELHMHACPGCAEQERLLRSLLAEAAALPREMVPARDLWPGIARRVEGHVLLGGRFGWRRPGAAWLAAAAVLLSLGVALLSWPRRVPSRMATSVEDAQAIPAAAGTAAVDAAEAQYVRATSELLAAVSARRETLSPETQAVLERNLQVIDDALREVREALRADPGNTRLHRMLASTHQKKIDVLRRVMRLSTL